MKMPSPLEPGVCPYCHFGLPSKTQEVWDRFGCEDDEFAFGPGHIVFSDENLEDHQLTWCLERVAEAEKMSPKELADNYPVCVEPNGLGQVKAALLALLEIPEAERCWESNP